MKFQGYGYEWDAKLQGGPADGCLDRVIQINDKNPPEYMIRILDGEVLERETLGEKLIEFLTKSNLDENQKVAVYKLDFSSVNNSENYLYEYIETTIIKKYRIKYESK